MAAPVKLSFKVYQYFKGLTGRCLSTVKNTRDIMTIGIYALLFEGTDKLYIGLSKDIEKRYIKHIQEFISSSSSKKLQDAYTLYGKPKLEILIACEESELADLEISAIEVYDSINNGFNTVNGGSLGCGLSGELNGRSKYSNQQIEAAFMLLVGECYHSYKDIAKIVGVSKSVITSIFNGTSHTWLKNKYPEKYSSMQNSSDRRISANVLSASKRDAKSRGIIYPKVISPTGEIYNIDNLAVFSKEQGLNSGALGRVLHGKAAHHKGWRI